jgi:hypothetical protein
MATDAGKLESGLTEHCQANNIADSDRGKCRRCWRPKPSALR